MSTESSPLDELERAVQAARVNRKEREKALDRVPQWRFRRRRKVERSVSRRRAWEAGLEKDLRRLSGDRT